MFNHLYERKVNNKMFSFQTNIARLGALTRPDSIRIPRPLVRLGFLLQTRTTWTKFSSEDRCALHDRYHGFHPNRPSCPCTSKVYLKLLRGLGTFTHVLCSDDRSDCKGHVWLRRSILHLMSFVKF